MGSVIRKFCRNLCAFSLLACVISLCALSISSAPAQAAAGINQQLNFQGRLLNNQGAIVPDGYYNIEFKVYQDGNGQSVGDTGGTLKWTEDYFNNSSLSTQGVQVVNGYLSVQLGSICPFSGASCADSEVYSNPGVNWNSDTLWLSMQIGNTSNCTVTAATGAGDFQNQCGGDGEMTPMKRLSANAYALNSQELGGLNSGSFVQLAQGLQTDATNNTSIYINKTGTGNILDFQTSGADSFMINNSGNEVFGANATHSVSVATAAASTAGQALTVSAGAAGSGASALAGGTLTLDGGAGGGTNGNGGNLALDAGAPNGTGTAGSITIGGNYASTIQLGNATNTTQAKTQAGGASTTLTNGGGQKVQGSGSSNTTNAFQVVNSSSTSLFQLVDDGTVNLGVNPANGYAFGVNQIGTTGQETGNNAIISGQKFTPTVSSTITSISVYAGSNLEATNKQFEVGLYADNSGTPGALLASSAAGTLTPSAWNTLAVNYSVTGSTPYWIAYISNVQVGQGTADGLTYTSPSSGNTHFFASYTYNGSLPGTITGATTVANSADSMYASAGSGPAISVNSSGSITTQTTFQNTANTTAALQVQNSSGDQILDVDTFNNQVVLGQASQVNGQILFQSTGGGYVGFTAPNISSGNSYALTLPSSAPTASSQCLATSGGTFTQLTFSVCGGGGTGNYINNAFGTTQAGNYNIQGVSSSAAVAILEANNGGTGDILDLLNGGGTPVATFDDNGNFVDSATGTSSFGGTLTVATEIKTPTLDTASAVPLNIGSTSTQINLNKSVQITGNATFANGAARSLSVAAASSGAGSSLTISAGAAGGSGNNVGGNLILQGGLGTGTGAAGLVEISTPTFQSVTNDPNCYTGGANVSTSCTIAQSSVDGNSAVVVGFSATGQTATLPAPTNTTPGRVFYIMAGNASQNFTLSVNGGGTGNTVAMRQNTSATMVWNGTAWGAAGASSSTTLQAAYDNTLLSAGGAELIVSHTSNTDGLNIRDSSTNPVNGPLLTVQTSSDAVLYSVNSNVTEYSTDSGAETSGGTSTSFPSSTWASYGTGSSATRFTTTGIDVATGQASVQVVTPATANTGVSNTLNAGLTANLNYNVSFAARLSTGTFTTMNVYYSVNGTTQSVQCIANQAVTISIWTKVNCTFTAPASGITSSNAIIIEQSDATARTFYVDNLSVTIAANQSYATDGDVEDATNFNTNWPQVGGATVTRSTTVGEIGSVSAQVVTGAVANEGVSNKLSIDPLPNTLYLVTVYADSNASGFNDFTIQYTPNGGTNNLPCVDYNTQTVSSSLNNFTEITCYITTTTTTASNPYLYFTQADATARTFYVDALSMTLSTNSTPDVQIGGGLNGGPATLFTLDRAASAPIADNNAAFLGSMYYDTTLGELQCYEASGWGSCGSSPNTVVTISPEYTNAVMHGTGVGTMTSDICSGALHINDGTSGQPSICNSSSTFNFYKWTSPQATTQTYSIYVTYQLPDTFKSFASGQTSLVGLTDSSNSTVQYELYRQDAATGLTQCGSSAVSVSTGSQSNWQTGTATGAEDPSTCGFVPNDSIVFKIDMTASQDANAYVSNLNFTFSHK